MSQHFSSRRIVTFVNTNNYNMNVCITAKCNNNAKCKTPKGFTEEVNNVIFDYIWKYKNLKLKKNTIIKNKKEGGLNMFDFTLFDNALKIVWVKRLCANDERPRKFIPLSLLSNVGGSLLFLCNYDIQYLPLNENLPKFYRDIISHWQRINNTNPKTKGDVLNYKVVQCHVWRKYYFRAKRNYIWCFKIHFVLFNSKSLDHNWKIFSSN